MFRKFDIKTLSWVFFGLLVFTVVVRVVDERRGINTLPSALFVLDEESIESLIVRPKMLHGEQIELKRKGEGWQVLSAGKRYNGDAATIQRMITMLNGLKPLRLASQDKARWDTYELSDSLASKVEFRGDKGELARLYVGKFSYTQAQQPAMMQTYGRPQGTMTTYVRSNKGKEVYAVEGFLSSLVNSDVASFRDKTLLKVEAQEVNKIVFSYPGDSSFTVEKQEQQWRCDGQSLDSAAVADYLSGIRALQGRHFSNAEDLRATHQVEFVVEQGAPIVVKAQVQGAEVLLSSSLNAGSCFEDHQKNTYNKIFVKQKSLLK